MAETTKIQSGYLSLDVTSRILSFLPIEDIVKYRAVCKAWYRLTKEPFFINLQLRATAFQHDRFILVPKSMSIYLLNTEKNNVREISLSTITEGWEQWHLSVMSSCHGFLCLASFVCPDPVLVCNPVTKERVILPTAAPCIFLFVHAALGYDPCSAKYKVVKVYKDYISRVCKGQILTLGETSWRPLDFSYMVLSSTSVLPRHCGGALYWMIDQIVHHHGGGYGFILVLNLSTEEFHVLKFPENTRLPRYPAFAQGFIKFYLANTGNILILSEYEDRMTHLWSMMRKSDREFRVCYYGTPLSARWSVFSRQVFIGTMDDCILLEVTKFGMDEERDLVLFCPKRMQYVGTQFRGLPPWFRTLTLRPNLLSPLVTMHGG